MVATAAKGATRHKRQSVGWAKAAPTYRLIRGARSAVPTSNAAVGTAERAMPNGHASAAFATLRFLYTWETLRSNARHSFFQRTRHGFRYKAGTLRSGGKYPD